MVVHHLYTFLAHPKEASLNHYTTTKYLLTYFISSLLLFTPLALLYIHASSHSLNILMYLVLFFIIAPYCLGKLGDIGLYLMHKHHTISFVPLSLWTFILIINYLTLYSIYSLLTLLFPLLKYLFPVFLACSLLHIWTFLSAHLHHSFQLHFHEQLFLIFLCIPILLAAFIIIIGYPFLLAYYSLYPLQ